MPENIADSLVVLSKLPATTVQFTYPQGFYHSEAYLKAQSPGARRSFWLMDHLQKDILGNVHFDLKEGQAISQLQAPFGSFDGLTLSRDQLQPLLTHLETDLSHAGCSTIIFHHPPAFYGGENWLSLLVDEGYLCTPLENYHIAVDQVPFQDKIHRMERRKLAKSRKLNFVMLNPSDAEEIYDFIEMCRQQRGQEISLDKQAFLKILSSNPRNFLLSAVLRGGQLIAAMVTIRVYSHIWYNFYPAHDTKFNNLSPLVFLNQKLYETAYIQGVKFLDLGTSVNKGRQLGGLITFKKRLGGITTSKWICTKQCD